jgi:hypothetical protein
VAVIQAPRLGRLNHRLAAHLNAPPVCRGRLQVRFLGEAGINRQGRLPGQFAVVQAMAPPSLAVELALIDVGDPSEIERAITAFARERNGGLIVTVSALAATYRDLIISLATRYRLPNIYGHRYYPASGGLVSYGPNTIESFPRAAAYVDRILKAKGHPTCRCSS